MSNIKWLAKDNGTEINGLGIIFAITAPKTTCGVSNIRIYDIMFVMIIANLVGIFLFVFLMWYKLRDDYHYEKIFNLVLFVFFGFLISFILSKYVLSQYWFWLLFISILSSFGIGINRLKIKFYESIDALIIALLPYLSLYFLATSILKYSLQDFIAFWIVSLFILIYFVLDSNYRKFTWYKSGRIGFSGLLVLGLFFAMRAVISYFFITAPSVSGTFDIFISASFSFVSFLLLFNLSRQVS